jgi:hypothetical protein
MLAAAFANFDDPNPSPGNQFGQSVLPLSTGDVVVTSPYDDYGGTDAGAVYLFNGATGALISALRGSHAGDSIGLDGVKPVGDGNFVVLSSNWDNGAIADAGAVTWGSGTAGIKGTINAANSLVGSTPVDQVGFGGVTVLTNGNYVVSSPFFNNGATSDAGAATSGSGAAGVKGTISAANSLVGNASNNTVSGGGVTPLTNGNYVVRSTGWDNGATANVGAATWGSGTAGVKGVVSAANSLIGSTAEDAVGYFVTPLKNGSYVVGNVFWDNGAASDAGAATWGSGTAGVKGAVSAANSLVGSTSNDLVGAQVVALTNGNYVVGSSQWNKGGLSDAGAATWGSGTAGVKGAISTANSLIGSTASDEVGYAVTPLTNGNYVVTSYHWDNGATANVGAVTWGSGTAGIKGVISAANSLIGSTAGDTVGFPGVTALTNGNYVVTSPYWNNGAASDAGAATWGSGTAGVKGTISVANSLVGSATNDSVGIGGVTALTNGNYVVSSNYWGNLGIGQAGAATWGSGTAGVMGAVSAANSLVGSAVDDEVGVGGIIALSNGNYVVSSFYCDNSGLSNAGAATWGSGTVGVKGAVSAANSLVGTGVNDIVGYGVTPLTSGNYVVRSPDWDNGGVVDAGAATWGSGTAGIKGAVSAANSLVGSTTNDLLGYTVIALANGSYVVNDYQWNNGAVVDAGAVTWGSGTMGVSGAINSQNSALGAAANTSLRPIVADNVNGTFFARFVAEGGGSIRVGSQYNGFLPTPLISSFGSGISYTENAAAVLISTTATVSDIDSNDFSGGELRVSFAANGQSSDRLAIRNQGTGAGQINVVGTQVLIGTTVIGTFSGGAGTTPLVVTLNSEATPWRVQTLLRNITYRNVSDNPSTASRTVRVTVSDGDTRASDPVTKQISVTAVNDRPTLGLSGTIGYVHDSAAILLASTATVSDVDSANFSGGRLRVWISSGGSSSNRLAIGSGFTVDVSNNVMQGETIIGQRTANGFGTNELIITFNTNATPSVAQQLARAITFKTVGGSAGTRTVRFTISDGDGGLSDEAVKTVNVT